MGIAHAITSDGATVPLSINLYMSRRFPYRALYPVPMALLVWCLLWLAARSIRPADTLPVTRDPWGPVVETTAINAAGEQEVIILTDSRLSLGHIPVSVRLRNWVDHLFHSLSGVAGREYNP